MSDLTITGHFGGPDAIESQQRFFKIIKRIADDQVPKVGTSGGAPVRFLWPEQGWDFFIYILSLKQTGASVAVETNERIHAPQYQLVGFVYEDNADLLKAVSGVGKAKFLQRITDGLGWQQSDYNGPKDYDVVARRLSGTSIFDFAFESYGLLEPTVRTSGATETSQQPPINPNGGPS
jgi:hypothetical protein